MEVSPYSIVEHWWFRGVGSVGHNARRYCMVAGHCSRSSSQLAALTEYRSSCLQFRQGFLSVLTRDLTNQTDLVEHNIIIIYLNHTYTCY